MPRKSNHTKSNHTTGIRGRRRSGALVPAGCRAGRRRCAVQPRGRVRPRAAAEIASRRLPAEACGALVWRFDADAQALVAMQLEALASDGQRLTAWPSSSSTREAKRLTHGRLRGAYLQLPASEATALVVEGPVDALAAHWLHPGAVVWCCGGALRLDPFARPRPGARAFWLDRARGGVDRPAGCSRYAARLPPM